MRNTSRLNTFGDLHPQKGRSLNGLRVLVVDDNADNLTLVKAIFEEYQAKVKTVASVNIAFEIIEKWKPDILISDISLPENDGYLLIRSIRIKEAEVGGFLPAIALTGYLSLENSRQAFNAGFQMFIPKPFESDELVEVVAKLTGRTIEVA